MDLLTFKFELSKIQPIVFRNVEWFNILLTIPEAYSEPSQIPKMEFFAKLTKDLKAVTIFGKSFILNV